MGIRGRESESRGRERERDGYRWMERGRERCTHSVI